MALRLRLAASIALSAALGCTGMQPGGLDSDARDSLAALAPRIEQVPPDLAALDEAVAIYAEHERYSDADDVIRGVTERAALDTAGLVKVAQIAGTLSNQAERAMRRDPPAATQAEVRVIAAHAHALVALARFRAQRDRGPVTAEVLRADGSQVRLRDVMLECASQDYEPDGALGSAFAVAYFGDRLRVTSDRGDVDAEARLGEIARLTIARDPLGRSRAWIDPHPWARETRACPSCKLIDPCTLVGNGPPPGGLVHVDLKDVSEATFGWEPAP